MAKKGKPVPPLQANYTGLIGRISGLLDQARRAAVRVTNALLTATYWEIGRQIVEFEQGGHARAEYGEELLIRLARDLSASHGRGFTRSSLQRMRVFYFGWEIVQTTSGQFQARVKCATLSRKLGLERFQTASGTSEAGISPTPAAKLQPVAPEQLPLILTAATPDLFPLPWSHYVRLMSVKEEFARSFYEDEAIVAGWSVRQLDRMISTQHYERTLMSKNKAAMLLKGRAAKPEDAMTLEETIRDPYILEFLNLKDEYGETDLEEAIIEHLESFLLEMGKGFAFIARQQHFRIEGESFRMDLVLFHRLLRCLVIIDLKIGKFSHADAGQMNLYLNYARENMKMPGENDPVGLILCSDKSDAVVKYAMGGINAKVFASQYLTCLPDAEVLRRELLQTKRAFETRAALEGKKS